MAPAGAQPARPSIGMREAEVGADEIVREPGKSDSAGWGLRPRDGVFRAARMLRCGWQEVWDGFSVLPAKWMGLDSGLEVGQPANFCLRTITAENQLAAARCFVRGESNA